MPVYAPQSLPDMERKGQQGQQSQQSQQGQHSQQGQRTQQNPAHMNQIRPHESARQLGRFVQRERGMQGVRSYVEAMREFLPQTEYIELCKAMGVQPSKRAQKPSNNDGGGNQAAQNPANQAQMMQMLTQLMGMQGGGDANGMGGMNPALLAQLLGGMAGSK